MRPIPPLAELAALQGDNELSIPKPLSEGAMAEVAYTMRLLNAASRHIDQAQGALEACKVPFDVQPFKTLQQCLNEAFATVCRVPLAQADAQARRGAQ